MAFWNKLFRNGFNTYFNNGIFRNKKTCFEATCSRIYYTIPKQVVSRLISRIISSSHYYLKGIFDHFKNFEMAKERLGSAKRSSQKDWNTSLIE